MRTSGRRVPDGRDSGRRAPGGTGWLAPRGDTVALAAALRAAAAQTPDQAALMSDRCRDFARRECDGTRQARRYLELFPETTTGPDPKS
ncbi:MAG: hypothetical protein U1G05_02430 [Kiritimatiellia bacterium]